MAIRIFITGGTFDKEYNELNGQLYFKDTHLNELLGLGRSLVPVEIRTLMMIDSLEMTDQDRELIAHQCNYCEEDQIVITHGTDTMADTAKKLVSLDIKTPHDRVEHYRLYWVPRAGATETNDTAKTTVANAKGYADLNGA